MDKLIFKKGPKTVSWPVTVQKPVDGGACVEELLTVRFSVLGGDAVEALSAQGDAVLYDGIVAGFEGLTDESGASVSDAVALPVFRDTHYIRRAIIAAYFAMLNGMPAAIAKN